MAQGQTAELDQAYSAVSANYKGADEDFHQFCGALRRRSPIMRGNLLTEHFGVPTNAAYDRDRPTFTLFRHADIAAVLRDAENFTSGFIAEGLGAFFDGLIILAMDGEQHRRARGLLQPAFMPKVVNRWREKIDRIVRTEFLEPLARQGWGDLMPFALNFPIRAIYAIVGFPEDDPEAIRRYAASALAILSGPQLDPAKAAEARTRAIEAARSLYDVALEVTRARRATGSEGDDLVGHLLRATFEGRMLDDHEIATFVRSLLPAAGETTTRTFSCMMTLLLERPALVERVKADRALIPKLIDEVVRFEPVATAKVRQAAKDLEIAGVAIPRGAMVQCIVSSANRDETVFERADEFDIDRKQMPSFGFGYGVHMCIGHYVAKAELAAALNGILDLMPDIRLDPDMPPPSITGAQLRGSAAVHARWD